MNEIVLTGCRPEPLAAYLKGLGVLRLLAEQRDPDAQGLWVGERFVLRSELDLESLVAFFMNEYVPTPLVAPWNNGSGFKRQGNTKAADALERVERSTLQRVEPYRAAIGAGRVIFERANAAGLEKNVVVETCRNELPDECVPWVDAAILLAGDNPSYPPVLGSGGNVGRADFTVAFLESLAQVLGLEEGRRSASVDDRTAWLRASLTNERVVSLCEATLSQYDPGSVGFGGSSPTGEEAALRNPWDFVLLLEGALVLAGAAARRLGAGSRGRAAVPFTVAAVAPVLGSESEVEGKRETWVPLWRRPSTLAELDRLFGEGRADWNGRRAEDGLDFARSVASLGVDRGIDTFVRYAFVERMGQSNAAVPVDRLRVRMRGGVAVTAALDGWLARIRRASNPPAGVERALRAVEVALYDVAQHSEPQQFQDLLVAVASLEIAVGRSSGFRSSAGVGPVTGLRADEWMLHLVDGSHELRVAAALASQHDDDGQRLRLLLRPIRERAAFPAVVWSDGPPRVAGIERVDLSAVLAETLVRRCIEVTARTFDDADELVGVQTAYRWQFAAPLSAVAAFVRGELDDERTRELLLGLMLLDWRGRIRLDEQSLSRESTGHAPPVWALLAPFYHRWSGGARSAVPVTLRSEAEWPRQLASNRVRPVVSAARRRLRVAGFLPAILDSSAAACNAPGGPRLAAALLCPLTAAGATQLLERSMIRSFSPNEEGIS